MGCRRTTSIVNVLWRQTVARSGLPGDCKSGPFPRPPARLHSSMDAFQPTERTRLRRIPSRGVYDRAQVYAILDEAYLCHVGFAVDGQPFVIPTGFARFGDEIFIHGSAASRMMRELGDGIEVCVTVTL